MHSTPWYYFVHDLTLHNPVVLRILHDAERIDPDVFVSEMLRWQKAQIGIFGRNFFNGIPLAESLSRQFCNSRDNLAQTCREPSTELATTLSVRRESPLEREAQISHLP